jgi:hypothetical protein
MFNAILAKDSELEIILSNIYSYEDIGSAYIDKLMDAGQKAKDRIDPRMNKIKGLANWPRTLN